MAKITAGRRLGLLPPRASSAIITASEDEMPGGAEGAAHGQRTVHGQRIVPGRVFFHGRLHRWNYARLGSALAAPRHCRRRVRREVADIEHSPQQLGLGQPSLRLRNHVLQLCACRTRHGYKVGPAPRPHARRLPTSDYRPSVAPLWRFLSPRRQTTDEHKRDQNGGDEYQLQRVRHTHSPSPVSRPCWLY